MRHYDLIIVGGGLVGAGLLLALQQKNFGLRIALIDASVAREDDPRLFALSMSSWQFLKNIGLQNALQAYASPIKSVHVSHQGRFGALRLRHEDVDLPALGYMLPAMRIESAMHQAMKACAAVDTSCTIFRPAKLTALTQDETKVTLMISTQNGDESITADYVIGADGTESTVRKLLQLHTESKDYQQSAIVTQTQLGQHSHHHIAYERFVAKGAIAMLPLQDNKVATIWSGQTERQQALYQLSDSEFLTELQKSFGFRLGKLMSISKRFLFPLKYVQCAKMRDNRVLLLGNALHTVHPIAAQGFNLALYEIAMLIDKLHEKHGKLSAEGLDALVDALQRQQKISLNVSNRITQLFFHESLLTKLFLPLGLFAFDKITPFKTRFIQHMLGRRTQAPRLLLCDDA